MVRRCHLCGEPTVDKYCTTDECEVFNRDKKINKNKKYERNNRDED